MHPLGGFHPSQIYCCTSYSSNYHRIFPLAKKGRYFHCPVPQIWVSEIRIKRKCQIRMRCLQNYFVTESKVMGENSSQKGVLNYEQSLTSARDQRSGQNARARLKEPRDARRATSIVRVSCPHVFCLAG